MLTGPYDPLYQYSIQGSGGGHFWTCNIAYRRRAFEAVGGFDDQAFPWAHAEDRDLGLRIERLGPVGYAPAMAIEHTPRDFPLSRFFRRGLWLKSDLLLEHRHPHAFPWDNRVPARARPVVGAVKMSLRYLATNWRSLVRSPRRLARTLAATVLSVAGSVTAALTYRRPR